MAEFTYSLERGRGEEDGPLFAWEDVSILRALERAAAYARLSLSRPCSVNITLAKRRIAVVKLTGDGEATADVLRTIVWDIDADYASECWATYRLHGDVWLRGNVDYYIRG